jgi:hypothetical protein
MMIRGETGVKSPPYPITAAVMEISIDPGILTIHEADPGKTSCTCWYIPQNYLFSRGRSHELSSYYDHQSAAEESPFERLRFPLVLL